MLDSKTLSTKTLLDISKLTFNLWVYKLSFHFKKQQTTLQVQNPLRINTKILNDWMKQEILSCDWSKQGVHDTGTYVDKHEFASNTFRLLRHKIMMT